MNKQLKFVTYGAVLLALAAVFPLLRLPQYLTGSVVICIAYCMPCSWDFGWGRHRLFNSMDCFNSWANAFCIYASIYYDWKCDFSNCVLDFKRYKTTGMIVGLVLGAFLKYLIPLFCSKVSCAGPSKACCHDVYTSACDCSHWWRSCFYCH